MDCTTEESSFDSLQGQEAFLYSDVTRPALGPTQPSIQWVLGPLSPAIKWPTRGADHLPLSTAEVSRERSCTSTPSCALVMCTQTCY